LGFFFRRLQENVSLGLSSCNDWPGKIAEIFNCSLIFYHINYEFHLPFPGKPIFSKLPTVISWRRSNNHKPKKYDDYAQWLVKGDFQVNMFVIFTLTIHILILWVDKFN